jgi:hypothetical protein
MQFMIIIKLPMSVVNKTRRISVFHSKKISKIKFRFALYFRKNKS